MAPYLKKSAGFILFLFCLAVVISAQETANSSDYIFGDEQQLEMEVAIWGEVRDPGKHRVSYNTNLVELISIAGGPTKSAKLTKVQLTRQASEWSISPEILETIMKESGGDKIKDGELKRRFDTASRKIVFYDVDKYLGDRNMLMPPPILQPGDVVYVRTSAWTSWRETIRVVHELALIASIYAWYLRAR
ncbi:SLBB domain-containing protein [candidate division KSB1 bacterium]|nr:SLBB domain-containing protein [candidate division KSB1 bacterium]